MVNPKAHGKQRKEGRKDGVKRVVGKVEEDIVESTRRLVVSLELQKREDRWMARKQDAVPIITPGGGVDRRVIGTNQKQSYSEEEDGKLGGGRGNHGGGGVEGGKVHVGRREGSLVEVEAGKDRKWAGREVGVLQVGFVEGTLVLEGVPLKERRYKGRK